MPLLTTRRSLWLPGVAVLVVAVCLTTLLGISVGARHWGAYVVLIVLVLAAMGATERLLERRRPQDPPKPAPPPRARLKVIRGGKDYDLAEDDRTENQRWLM